MRQRHIRAERQKETLGERTAEIQPHRRPKEQGAVQTMTKHPHNITRHYWTTREGRTRGEYTYNRTNEIRYLGR